MKDDRLANVIDVLQLCVAGLSMSVATPPEDQRDLAGIIKHFEMTFEQCYRCLLELLLASGEENPRRSVKTVFRAAHEFGWITDDQAFSAMIRDRNSTSHTYDAEFASEMVERITVTYLPLFRDLLEAVTKVSKELSGSE